MNSGAPSFRKIAFAYLCFYAIIYPLATHLLMIGNGDEGVGALPIQIFQATVVVTLLGLWRFGRASERDILDIWVLALGYFSVITFYIAFIRTSSNPRLELLGGARFLAWFLFAASMARGVFPKRQIRNLAISFWIGSSIQGLIAVWTFFTHGAGSTYSDVYASTGSANVSGKTVVSFIVLNLFLSIYWLIVGKKLRPVFLFTALLGLAVVLFSYNRASQLALAFVCFGAFFWFVHKERMKAAGIFVILGCFTVAFFCSPLGEVFLSRWNEIAYDHGSGRVTLIAAAIKNLFEPNSFESLLIGLGFFKMEALMYEACGAYIGTHSDLFDFLTVYGVVGGVFYLVIAARLFFVNFKTIHNNSIENLFLRAATLFILLTGLFTGLFQATYTFFMLVVLQYYLLSRDKTSLVETDIVEVIDEIVYEDESDEERQGSLTEEEKGANENLHSQSLLKRSDGLNDVAKIDAAFRDIDFDKLEKNENKRVDQKARIIDEIWREKGRKKDTDSQDGGKNMLGRDKYIDDFFESAEDF